MTLGSTKNLWKSQMEVNWKKPAPGTAFPSKWDIYCGLLLLVFSVHILLLTLTVIMYWDELINEWYVVSCYGTMNTWKQEKIRCLSNKNSVDDSTAGN